MDFTAAIGLDPKNADGFCCRGMSLSRTGDFQKAVADLTEAIRLDVKNVDAYEGRAVAYEHTNDWKKSLADFNTAIALKPGDAHLYAGRANVLFTLGSSKKALADLDEAVRLDPKNLEALEGRGNLRAQIGDVQGALEDFAGEVKLAPKRAIGWYNRGSMYARLEKLKEGIADYSESERLGFKAPSLFRNRGYLRWKAGDEQNAAADLRAAVAAAPNDPLANAYFGELLATSHDKRIRDTKSAVAHASRACEVTKWTEPQFLTVLGKAYAESGDFKNAVQWQEKAVSLMPKSQVETARRRLEAYRLGHADTADDTVIRGGQTKQRKQD